MAEQSAAQILHLEFSLWEEVGTSSQWPEIGSLVWNLSLWEVWVGTSSRWTEKGSLIWVEEGDGTTSLQPVDLQVSLYLRLKKGVPHLTNWFQIIHPKIHHPKVYVEFPYIGDSFLISFVVLDLCNLLYPADKKWKYMNDRLYVMYFHFLSTG